MNLVDAGPLIMTFHNDLHHHTKRNSTFCTSVFLCSIWFSQQELCPYTALIHWFFYDQDNVILRHSMKFFKYNSR